LKDIVVRARDGTPDRLPNLFFSTDVDQAILESDLIFVAVNTPTKTAGSGAGYASELGFFEMAIRRIAEVAEDDKIIVEKSTVPCRTAANVREILAAIGKRGVQFDVLSNPEFLAEGTAVKDLLAPDRILIGSLATDDGSKAAEALANVYASWVPRDRIITMNLWSSELAKLAANALLAQRISSINALSAVCEATGANIDEVSYACGLDTRIGPKMLKASVGFGGSCFKKDILSLSYISESLHLPEVSQYWKSVVDINEYQKNRFIKRIISCLFNSLTLKKIAILGFAYKKNTADTRESAAITIVQNLVAEGAICSIYDPKVREDAIMADFDRCDDAEYIKQNITVCSNVYDACYGAHAVVILTEWDEFSNKPVSATTPAAANPQNRASWEQIATNMQRPMYVFDGRNVVDQVALERLGFRVEAIGRPGTRVTKRYGSGRSSAASTIHSGTMSPDREQSWSASQSSDERSRRGSDGSSVVI
jgi:UDPglucose 6-dehydrogenase